MTLPNHIGVIGLGLLGRGICAALITRGLEVTAVGLNDSELDAARAEVLQAIREMEQHGFTAAIKADGIDAVLHRSSDIAAVAECDFVIESVTEDLSVKQQVLLAAETHVTADTPIATNTSAIPIAALQSVCQQPERILGMHWAEPAYATDFIELIRGEPTGDAAFYKAVLLAEHCGKQVCVVKRDLPGFIANRIGYAMYREAAYLVEMGVADPETIDRSVRNSIGLWAHFCGPFRWIDISGGPTLYAKAMTPVLPTLSNADTPPALLLNATESQDELKGIYQMTAQETEAWLEQFRQHVWALKNQQPTHAKDE